ncbi:variant erythrocyte surface antigen-1 family protein [Babesia divergens]|uniref:Variant erythrocyte surface antigen-1 family protein n=1 Tax=Babesia divergens TaxID=32595 RepID=A0AAD9LG01_BABDI|nr:variant erythrocyte surface antigen-1 family protein [Babesia divergens]
MSFSTGSSYCASDPCCDYCDVKKAAKIFLGFIPALYFGLKILWVRCKNGSSFAGWHDISILSGKPESALTKFLKALGFDVNSLNGLKGSEISLILDSLFGSSGILKSLYNFVSQKYFSRSLSSTSHSKPPQTVRSMLLWLYGLRFTPGFSSLVLYCSSLCSPFGNFFNSDAFLYYLHTCCFLLPVSVLTAIQCPDGSDSFLPSHSDWQNFCYPSDTLELFGKFCEYVRKIYIPLSFLRFQCKRVPGQAGWQNCYFGQKCSLPNGNSLASSASSPGSPCCSTPGSNPGQGYLCTASKPSVHDHCAQGKCRGFGSGSSVSCDNSNNSVHPKAKGKTCSNPCPHPLMRFLCDSDSLFKTPQDFLRLDFSQTPPAILEASSDKFLTMGFQISNLSPTAKPGSSLGHVLHVFCDDGFYPLARLLEFALYVTLRPPSTLLELFVFFRKFVYSDVFKTEFPNYASGEPGSPSGENLRIAVQRLFNHTSHSNDLKSLYDCDGPKGPQNSYGSPVTCGKYLFYLYNNDGVFDRNFLGLYLSFVCHLTKALKNFLEEFKMDFESCSDCSSGSCQKIVECPCILPKLYKYGFSFWSPGDLNCVTPSGNSKHTGENSKGEHFEGDSKCTQKSCFEFIIQLERVISGKPFEKLLDAIEAFLWSIRFPFFFGFLYVWFFVLSYFCYVILIKLDTVHTGSHLHLPRSFKILPSTLFSDASSRLKDLSYFTL